VTLISILVQLLYELGKAVDGIVRDMLGRPRNDERSTTSHERLGELEIIYSWDYGWDGPDVLGLTRITYCPQCNSVRVTAPDETGERQCLDCFYVFDQDEQDA